MSINSLFKSEMSVNILACLGCLATTKRLYCLNDKITEAYKYLTGMDTTSYDGVSQYICAYCSTLLLKYMAFRNSCRDARYILHDAKMRDEIITTDYLNQINDKFQYKQIQTEIKLLSVHNDSITFDNLSQSDITDDKHHHPIKCDVSPEYCLSDDLNITSDNSSQKYDHTIETMEYCQSDDTKIFIKMENPESDEQKIHKTSVVKIEKFEKYNKKSSSKIEKIKKSNSNKRKSPTISQETDTFMRKGKYFETKENMEGFEKEYNVDILTLTKQQQLQDVLDRKLTFNYQHSPYRCELCYKGFMDENILKKHASSQHNPSRSGVVCEFCHFGYKDKRALTQHLRKHRLRFACKQCKYVSRTTFNAKEHYKTHSGHLYECQHCGKSYENISSHLSHMRLHHPSELMWCELCGEAFIGQFGLNAHKKRAHRDLSLSSHCQTCGKHFASATALRNHAQQSRDGCATVNSCAHCGDCFEDTTQLRNHLLTVHRSSKVYACEKCAKTFTHESQYRAHYRRMHVESEEVASRKKARPWVCEVCGKACPTNCRLLYHQRTHTGERPYRCTHCPKNFTMKRLLQSHLRVHTSDRPYACKLCSKTFKRLPALRNHEHIHLEGQVKTSKKRRIST